MSLTIIVPFYNEEKNIEECLKRLVKIDCYEEIILVDDCSTDNSFQIAKKIKNKYPNIQLHQNKKNTGKGSCVIYAKSFLKTSHVIVHDADLEYDPNDILKLYSQSLKNPQSLILGSRTIGNIKRNKKYKILVLVNKIFAMLFSIINSNKVSDISSCYMLIPSSFLKKFIYEEMGFGIEIEIVSKFIRTKKQIIEIPINYSSRSYAEGKKIKLKDGINIFFKIFRYRIR